MAKIKKAHGLWTQQKQPPKLTILLLTLLFVCAVGRPAAGETSVYVFDPNGSTVTRSGGFIGTPVTYSVAGRFQLRINGNTAAFENVNANLTDEAGSVYSQSLNEVFNMSGLTGDLNSIKTIIFTGKTADGTESDVTILLTFEDGAVRLKGQTTPPPESADMFIYELDAVATRKYAGGTGEPNDPYLIYTAEQMNAIGADPNDWDKHFKLMADIDLSVYKGTDFNIIGYWVDWYFPDNVPFTGIFDGNGHRISNFSYMTTIASGNIGLFAYVDGDNAQIKDLGLIDPNIDARGDVGSFVGQIFRGTITKCYVEGGGIIGNDHVGGLVGQNYGTITNCYSNATVTGGDSVGGLVGYNDTYSRISRSYSIGRISGREYVGGLVGNNRGEIVNCYAMGSVLGNKIVGGFVGGNGWPQLPMSRPYPPAEITNCYSVGSVSGSNHIGGLVGRQGYGRATTSLWDIQTSGQTTSDGGMGKTTDEMQMVNTFIAWGCEPTIWTIDEGVDYPRLSWENKPGSPLQVLSEFLAGSGTQTDPYLIYTAQELSLIGQFPCEWSKQFKLMADIDLSGFTQKAFSVIGDWRPFTGVFDGNSHTISNFSYISTEAEYSGLFRHVGKWGEGTHIKDLGLIDPNVDAGKGYYVGSLIGRLSYGTITCCYAKGGSISGNYCVGGLVGWLDGGTITNCYSSSSIKGTSCVGGLTGYNYRSPIINSYSTGSVSGNDNIGGLLGYNLKGEITNSFWDKEISGQATSAGGVGLTTVEMQTASTFLEAGWDFVGETENGTEDIWWILEGQDYPRLWWELSD